MKHGDIALVTAMLRRRSNTEKLITNMKCLDALRQISYITNWSNIGERLRVSINRSNNGKNCSWRYPENLCKSETPSYTLYTWGGGALWATCLNLASEDRFCHCNASMTEKPGKHVLDVDYVKTASFSRKKTGEVVEVECRQLKKVSCDSVVIFLKQNEDIIRHVDWI